MSDYSLFLCPNRTVLITAGVHIGEVGRIIEWNEVIGKWEVDLRTESAFKASDELDPLLTIDQVVDFKIEEQAKGSDLKDKVKDFGMSSEELAEAVTDFITKCANRIKGVGDSQYSEDGYQKFEVMDLDDLLEYILEEIRDIPNYCAMLEIRIQRLRRALVAVDVIEERDEEVPSD